MSKAEKSFLKTKQISSVNTPDEWLKFFKRLKEFDRQGDSSRKWGFGFGCLGLIILIAGLFLIGAIVGYVIIPIGAIIGAAGFFIYFYLKPYDIPGDILSKTLIPLILIIREEMNPQEGLKLRVDLRGFAIPEKIVNQTKPYARGSYHKIIDSFYRDPWLDGDTRFADGTRLIWSIEDLVKSSSKSKRNPRGKHKTKTKDKHQSRISLQVGMHNKRYSLPEKVKQKGVEGAIRTKDAGDYSWMSINKMVKHPVGQTFAPQDFVNSIASAYIRATPAGGKKQ